MRSKELQVEFSLHRSSETRSKVVDWRNLFNAAEDHALQYFLPQTLEGRLVVAPPQNIFEEGESRWQNTVVAQFIGRVPNFSLFQKIVKGWGGYSTASGE